MKQIAAQDATAKQLADYIGAHDIEIAASQRRSKKDLLELLKSAKLGDPILVADSTPGSEHQQTSDELAERFAEPMDDKNERWCRIRFAPDNHGQDKESIIPICHNTDLIWVQRNKDVVIRERFLRVVCDAVEHRVSQTGGDGSSQKFSEAQHYTEQRYPFTFMGFCGLVSDGPPDGLPETVHIIQ